MSIDYLLQFEEENKDLLSFKLSSEGILIWPLIRFSILQKAFSDALNLQASYRSGNSMLDMDFYQKSFCNNPFNIDRKFSILIFGTARGNVFKKDGKFFNYMLDYFALANGDQSLIIEDSFQNQYFLPRYFGNVRFHDSLMLLAGESSRNFIISEVDNRTIQSFVKFFKEKFLAKYNEEFYNYLICKLKFYSRRLEYYKFYYKSLFCLVEPKVIFLNCASYGERSYIIKYAKSMGIKLGEFQHGTIYKDHIAYNYCDYFYQNNEYKQHLPDYLLTYGQFWSDNIRTPVKNIIIGNPHYSTRVNNYKSFRESKLKIILIISQGTMTNTFVDLTIKLAKLIRNKEYKIIFRLHPAEVLFEERFKDLVKLEQVELSYSGDIYDLISESSYIVGAYSTTIFEALGFHKQIFVYEHELSKSIPETIGSRFKSAEELYELLNSNVNTPIKNVNYYWNDNWEQNYQTFINNIIK